LAADGVPPELVAQAVEFQLPPEVKLQYTVFGDANIMLELPVPSPKLVPVNGAAVPAPVIPEKSQFVRETVAAEIVTFGSEGESILVRISKLAAPEFTENVPVIICALLLLNDNLVTDGVDRAVTVKLL